MIEPNDDKGMGDGMNTGGETGSDTEGTGTEKDS